MLREERCGDVTRLHFASWRSRAMGYAVSAWVVRGALVDTGFPAVGPDLGAWLDANGRAVSGVIVTHYHEDHAGNAERVARRGLPMWLADATRERVQRPDPIRWYRRWCWGSPAAMASNAPAFAPEHLEVIPTPGHSSDHHVVWDAERETLVAGDLFLGVKVRVAHPWPREDVRAQIASLRRAIALRPARLYDAHRGLVPDPVAQLAAKAQWIEETVGQVDALIAQGWDDRAIVHRVFGGEDPMALVTAGDYSRRNFVGSVRATSPTAPSRTPP